MFKLALIPLQLAQMVQQLMHTDLEKFMDIFIMEVAINKSDNSVCCIEMDGKLIPPAVYAMENVKIVDVDPACFDNIDKQYWDSMFFMTQITIQCLKTPNLKNLATDEGKEWLIEELQKMSLVPASARTADFDMLSMVATQYLGADKVAEILADDIVTDEEIEDIMDYLNTD